MKYIHIVVLLLALTHYASAAQTPCTLARYTKSASVPSAIAGINDPVLRAAAIDQLKAKSDGEFCVYNSGDIYAFAPSDNVKDGEIAIKGSGAYYINNRDKSEVSIKSVMDRQFVVTSKHEDSKWQVTPETQIIANHKCRKAICPETNAEAWFTTEIPIATGPNGVTGLPGLIVKLVTGASVYLLCEIEECKELSIVLPKGKIITKEEFHAIRQKRLNEMGVGDSKNGVQIITL